MNRRQFLKTLVAVPLAAVALPKVMPPTSIGTWDGVTLVMHPAQKKFYDSLVKDDLWMGGIPYHQNNGTIGTWMGISRSQVPMFRSSR